MEEIFINALATRSYSETDLLDKLPEDVRSKVEERLETEQPQELQVYEDTLINP